jgi:hypothetical protein
MSPMPADNWDTLEAALVALNEWLYADEAGLEPPEAQGDALAARLAGLYGSFLDRSGLGRSFFLDSWAEARRVTVEAELVRAMDAALVVPELRCSAGPLTWRNWKAYEREAPDGPALNAGFEALVSRSTALVPVLEQSLARLRADYAPYGLTPSHTFAEREGMTVESLRALLLYVGTHCRPIFQAALAGLSQQVFGREAGPAELRALYLNRMYEPNAWRFDAGRAVAGTLSAFERLGFDLSRVPVDVADRPRKYPGAFCFPVHTPGDVRVSVRMASAHHLVDMLYHELGHAVHFSGIRPEAHFLDRYWITSGVHETFSTLFESLLAEPHFLAEQFGFDAAAVDGLLAFGQFKDALTANWLGASALTVLDTWLEELAWADVEARFARHMQAFTGVEFPLGFARLEPFTARASIYPAGYLLAWARVDHWRQQLRALGGDAWWRSPAARADVRQRVAAGGVAMFPSQWVRPERFLARLRQSPIMGRAP